ncbi:MAG: hypothetical protein Q8K99_14170 [Actinomycetota bacterium]|nr:hypothetical protein [Actinomycetota bacterium]
MSVKTPELLPLFDEAKKLLAPYAKRFTPRRDEPGYYDLWSERDLVIGTVSRTRLGVETDQ